MQGLIQRSWFKYIGMAAGAALGAFFGHVEYGQPGLGLIVGSGVGHFIGFALKRRFGNSF